MPAPPELLTHRRVLRAADRGHDVIAGDTDIAADTLADGVDLFGADLLRQEGVGNRRTRGAYQIKHAGFDLPHHLVGRGEASDTDHGFAGQLLQPRDIVLLTTFGTEPGGHRVVFPGSHDEVP